MAALSGLFIYSSKVQKKLAYEFVVMDLPQTYLNVVAIWL